MALLAIVFIPTIYFSNNTPTASAVTRLLSGHAWSSNTGWISFSGTDGGNVAIDSTTGNLIGYAWSENIGWIYFGGDPGMAGGIANAPEAPFEWAKLNFSTGDVTGWARVCSVFQSGCSGTLNSSAVTGGWDGWIKMSDALRGYGVKSIPSGTTRTFYGYAWGGGSSPTTDSSPQSPGWISFNYLKDQNNNPIIPPPTGCTTNCGFVTVTETVTPPAITPISATCYVDGTKTTSGQELILTQGDSVPLSIQATGGTGSFNVQWYIDNQPEGSPSFDYLFNKTGLGGYIVYAIVNSGTASPVKIYCPDGEYITVKAPVIPTTLGFDNMDNVTATVKFTNNEPTKAYKTETEKVPSVAISLNSGEKPLSLIDLSVVDVYKTNKTETIDKVYWNYNNSNKPVFDPSAIEAQKSSELTIQFTRQPVGLSRLASGVYYIYIKGTPKDPKIEPFFGWLKVTISSSGGIYIER